jgi:oligopeptide transport system substrate-binding protein
MEKTLSRSKFLRTTVGAAIAAGSVASKASTAFAAPTFQVRHRTQEFRFVHGGGTSVTNLPTLDVVTTGATLAILATWQLQCGLFYSGGDSQLHNGMVDDYTVGEDGLTYTFSLKPGILWSDGSPFTARDIKYSWDRAAWPETRGIGVGTSLSDVVGIDEALRGETREISGVQVVDDRTLQVSLKAPNSSFLTKLGIPWGFGWVKQDVLERNPEAYFAGRQGLPLSTGPFRIDEWVPDDRIIFTRNPYFASWFGEAANLEVMHLLFNRDPSTLLVAYENNEIDLVSIDAQDVPRFNAPGLPHYSELQRSLSGTNFLVFKPSLPPFDDPLVRQAFYRALDRAAIAKGVYVDTWRPARSIFAEEFPWFNQNANIPSFDAAEAKSLLARSKYGSAQGLPPIRLVSTTYLPYQRCIVAMQGQWRDNLGVNVEIKQAEFPFEPAAQRSQVNINGRGYLMSDINWMPYSVWEGEGAWNKSATGLLQENGSYNGYRQNPEIDQVIYRAASSLDLAEQAQLYAQVEAQIVAQSNTIPLFHEFAHALMKPWVQGYVPRQNYNESYGLPPSNIWISDHR